MTTTEIILTIISLTATLWGLWSMILSLYTISQGKGNSEAYEHLKERYDALSKHHDAVLMLNIEKTKELSVLRSRFFEEQEK